MKTMFLSLLVFSVLLFQMAVNASERNPLEKKYRCPICGLVQIYTLPGIHECPVHKATMLEVIE